MASRSLSRLADDEDAPASVMVTHHVEEIPRATTHAMLLQRGRVVAQGPIATVLTSEHLTAAFGLALEVDVHDGRYTARARRS